MNAINTVPSPTPTVTPAKRNRKNNGGVALVPSADPKALWVTQINSACAAYAAGVSEQSRLFSAAAKAIVAPRASFKEIVAQAAASGLFTAEELRETVKQAAKAAGMADSTWSRALTDCGLRERAKRSDAGKSRNTATEANAKDTVPPAIPAAPALATSPEAIAQALVAALGKDAAMEVLAKAYHLAKASK